MSLDPMWNMAVLSCGCDCCESYSPDSRILISLRIADISLSRFHSGDVFSLAKFCLMSLGSFKRIIGTVTSKSP